MMNPVLLTVLILLLFLLLLFVLVLFLIKPNQKRPFPLDRLYAHRGYFNDSMGIPENSLAAFERAAELGLGVELDVRLTKDQKLVVFHDGDLRRMCGREGKIADFTYDELSSFRLKGTEEKIPLFEEVLDTLGGVPIICEIKEQGGLRNTDACPITASMLDGYKGETVIESFNPFIVGWFKKNRPDIIRGQLACGMRGKKGKDAFQGFLLRHLLVNVIGRPDFVAYCYKDSALGFRLCRSLFSPVLAAWTLRERDAEAKCRDYPCLIFEETSQIDIQNHPCDTTKGTQI